MSNAEARSQLREMLEFQIREKEKIRAKDASKREKIYHHSYIMKDQNQLARELVEQKNTEQLKKDQLDAELEQLAQQYYSNQATQQQQ